MSPNETRFRVMYHSEQDNRVISASYWLNARNFNHALTQTVSHLIKDGHRHIKLEGVYRVDAQDAIVKKITR